jgi:hypothetical protein
MAHIGQQPHVHRSQGRLANAVNKVNRLDTGSNKHWPVLINWVPCVSSSCGNEESQCDVKNVRWVYVWTETAWNITPRRSSKSDPSPTSFAN